MAYIQEPQLNGLKTELLKISIITISFNSADTIEETIQSVLDQDYENVEYIIIDGGSTDTTMNIVNRYSDKINTVVSEPDKGLYDAMNKGVDKATGDVIGILNSDDVYAHNKVLSKVAHIMLEQNSDGLYADLQYVDRQDLTKVKRTWISGSYKKGSFKKGWMPPHPTFFVKKVKYTQLGGYNTELSTSADYELMLRFIHKHKISICYLADIITLMRVGGQSNVSIKNRIKANKEDRMAWKINGLKSGWFTHLRKPLSKIKQLIKK